ncbi:single-stranded DNA-binding protein [Fontivita pretiosa]|uniref:single-stranded DNA-binding protein n=1 Tax=Fontivita pretiosa TaxID=2989684 RepID=UPI003D17301E
MPSFNRVTLIGNLTRDPQVRHLPSNTTVADFGLAMNRRYRTHSGEEKEEVCFVDCTAFGRQAEVIAQFCKKGRQLFVEGRLKYEQWDDKTQGMRRSKLSVVVENFQFLGARDEVVAGGVGGQKTFADPDQRPSAGQQQPARSAAPGGDVISQNEGFTDADIPF